MRISEVRLQNLKGQNRTITLSETGLNVIDGPNGSGKTAVLQAIALAITGEVPGVGKRSIRGLASGAVMSAGVTVVSEGRTLEIDRSFELEGDSVEEFVRINPSQNEKSTKACNERIRRELGDAATMVNLGEFLGLTPGKRAEMLMRLVGSRGAAVSPDDMASEIRGKGVDLPADVVRDVRNVWRGTGNPAENLEAAAKLIAAKLSESEGQEREANAAAKRLIDAKAELESPGTSEELATELAKVRESRDLVRATLAADLERQRAYEAAQAALERAVKDHARAEAEQAAAYGAAKAAEDDATVAQAEWRFAEESPAPAEPAAPPDDDQDLATSQMDYRAIESQARDARIERDRIARAAEGARAEHVSCPIALLPCPVPEWVKDRARDALAAAEQGLAALSRSEADALRLYEEAARAHRASSEAYREAQEARGKERADRALRIQALTRRLSGATAKLSGAEARVTAARNAVSGASERIAMAQKAAGEVPGRINREEAEGQLGTLEDQITELDGLIARKERARAISEEIVSAQAARAAAEERGKLLRRVRTAAKTVTSELLQKVMAPLVESTSALLGGVRAGWRLIVEAVPGGLELCAVTGPGRKTIPWAALSGGEAIVFGAALSIALSRLQAAPARYLLLEAAEVDSRNFTELLQALGDMSDDIDTILVATCHSEAVATVPEGWRVLTLPEGVLA